MEQTPLLKATADTQQARGVYTYLNKLFPISNSQFPSSTKIILAEREPVSFIAGFLVACQGRCSIFLCNPDWSKSEWQQVFDLVQPDVVWGIDTQDLQIEKNKHHDLCETHIMIPTGGSSGKIKFAIHTWQTLMASVRGFTEYFQVDVVNSFCLLPLYHVSGLMQFMRSFSTGGKLVIQPFKEVELGNQYKINPSEFFISLVPTQLQRLLQNRESIEWLSQFKTVLLGGAPAGKELLEKARYYNIRLATTYGMTETASQIAALKPDDFLRGKVSAGNVLPHAEVIICDSQGKILDNQKIGNVKIKAESLALGYYPDLKRNKQQATGNSEIFPYSINQQDYLEVDDIGFLDAENNLHIIGRNSDKIITGGENVYPIEVESAILATEMVCDVCIIGIQDNIWGQAVTAIYVPKISIDYMAIAHLLQDKLSKFKIPKYWIPVESLPRNVQGKINRQQLQEIVANLVSRD